jgi:predicted O-methyltransferase YrrM
MKQTMLKVIDKAARRASQTLSFSKPRGDSFDVLEIAFLKAAYEAAEYYEENLQAAHIFHTDLDLLSHAISIAAQPGLILEFGVATGRTITHISGHVRSAVYGFDSFEGLPEMWRSGFEQGSFAGDLPPVPPNVELVKGWFKDTLPLFLANHDEPVSLLHVDCDIYSSTKTIFDLLSSRLRPHTVIVFDEYWNYPGWRQHQFKAFGEFIQTSGLSYRYDSFAPGHQQVCVVLEAGSSSPLPS